MPMSIAVSAVIRPSRRLRRLHALLCVLVLAAAGAFRQPVPQCVMVGAVFVSACRRRAGVNGVRLDISGVGGIRLAVYRSNAQGKAQSKEQGKERSKEQGNEARNEAGNDVAPAAAHARDGPELAAAGREVWLMPGSTLWPALLLLRLRSGDGTVFWLPVLPDTVAPDVLRRVALAMRAIAAKGPPAA